MKRAVAWGMVLLLVGCLAGAAQAAPGVLVSTYQWCGKMTVVLAWGDKFTNPIFMDAYHNDLLADSTERVSGFAGVLLDSWWSFDPWGDYWFNFAGLQTTRSLGAAVTFTVSAQGTPGTIVAYGTYGCWDFSNDYLRQYFIYWDWEGWYGLGANVGFSGTLIARPGKNNVRILGTVTKAGKFTGAFVLDNCSFPWDNQGAR